MLLTNIDFISSFCHQSRWRRFIAWTIRFQRKYPKCLWVISWRTFRFTTAKTSPSWTAATATRGRRRRRRPRDNGPPSTCRRSITRLSRFASLPRLTLVVTYQRTRKVSMVQIIIKKLDATIKLKSSPASCVKHSQDFPVATCQYSLKEFAGHLLG